MHSPKSYLPYHHQRTFLQWWAVEDATLMGGFPRLLPRQGLPACLTCLPPLAQLEELGWRQVWWCCLLPQQALLPACPVHAFPQHCLPGGNTCPRTHPPMEIPNALALCLPTPPLDAQLGFPLLPSQDGWNTPLPCALCPLGTGFLNMCPCGTGCFPMLLPACPCPCPPLDTWADTHGGTCGLGCLLPCCLLAQTELEMFQWNYAIVPPQPACPAFFCFCVGGPGTGLPCLPATTTTCQKAFCTFPTYHTCHHAVHLCLGDMEGEPCHPLPTIGNCFYLLLLLGRHFGGGEQMGTDSSGNCTPTYSWFGRRFLVSFFYGRLVQSICSFLLPFQFHCILSHYLGRQGRAGRGISCLPGGWQSGGGSGLWAGAGPTCLPATTPTCHPKFRSGNDLEQQMGLAPLPLRLGTCQDLNRWVRQLPCPLPAAACRHLPATLLPRFGGTVSHYFLPVTHPRH